MTNSSWCFLLLLLFTGKDATYVELFNGRDLSGWVDVYGQTGNWWVSDGALLCGGRPRGYLRTERQYENFSLDLDWRGDSTAIVVYADALPASGEPLPRGTRLLLGGSASWHHSRIESHSGHVRVFVDGKPRAGDGSSGDGRAGLRKGYVALVCNGSQVAFKNIRLNVYPSTNPAADETAAADQGFQSLYDGRDLQEWKTRPGDLGHWSALDWVINYDGRSQEKDKCLWSKKSYADFILIADVRLMRKPEPAPSPVILPNGEQALNPDGSKKVVSVPYNGDTGIYLRGSSKSQVNIGNRYIGSGEIYGYRTDTTLPADVRAAVTPKIKADNAPGQWNRFVIIMKGSSVSVQLNGVQVIQDALLPGIAPDGPLALQDDHADNNQFQFANVFIKELR